MQDSLVVDEFMTRAADVIHDLVLAAFGEGLSDSSAQVVEHFVPGHALPFPFPAFACTPQRIKNAFRIVHLVDRRRALGAVASATAGMRRVPLKLLNAHLLFVNVS